MITSSTNALVWTVFFVLLKVFSFSITSCFNTTNDSFICTIFNRPRVTDGTFSSSLLSIANATGMLIFLFFLTVFTDVVTRYDGISYSLGGTRANVSMKSNNLVSTTNLLHL